MTDPQTGATPPLTDPQSGGTPASSDNLPETGAKSLSSDSQPEASPELSQEQAEQAQTEQFQQEISKLTVQLQHFKEDHLAPIRAQLEQDLKELNDKLANNSNQKVQETIKKIEELRSVIGKLGEFSKEEVARLLQDNTE